VLPLLPAAIASFPLCPRRRRGHSPLKKQDAVSRILPFCFITIYDYTLRAALVACCNSFSSSMSPPQAGASPHTQKKQDAVHARILLFV